MRRSTIAFATISITSLSTLVVATACEPSCEDTLTCGPFVPLVSSGGSGPGAGGSTSSSGATGGAGGSTAATGGEGGTFQQIPRLGAGQFHNCITTPSGATAKCWGRNGSGELGNDSTTSSATPVETVAFEAPVVQVDGGRYFTCFLLANGTVWCAGENDMGQLGNGTTTMSTEPTKVVGVEGATSIAVAHSRGCAIFGNRTARCWGRNGGSYALLGDESTVEYKTEAVDVDQTGIAQLALDTSHTCALLTNGTVRCWGAGAIGQLGDGNTHDVPYPVTVAGIDDAVSIAPGESTTCVVRSQGEVWCWGKSYGNLPQQIQGISAAVEIVGGSSAHCARLSAGEVWCFGLDSGGQLGDGPTMSNDFFAPVKVLNLTQATGLSKEHYSVCATTEADGVWCWGISDHGQLGNGTTTASDVPVKVDGL